MTKIQTLGGVLLLKENRFTICQRVYLLPGESSGLLGLVRYMNTYVQTEVYIFAHAGEREREIRVRRIGERKVTRDPGGSHPVGEQRITPRVYEGFPRLERDTTTAIII